MRTQRGKRCLAGKERMFVTVFAQPRPTCCPSTMVPRFFLLFLLVEFTIFGMNMVNLLLRRDTRISSSCVRTKQAFADSNCPCHLAWKVSGSIMMIK